MGWFLSGNGLRHERVNLIINLSMLLLQSYFMYPVI